MNVGVQRYSELLRRLLRMEGRELIASDLAPELVATLVLENDRPEWGYLTGTRFWSAGVIQAAGGAGTFTQVRIRNPADSASLIVVTGFEVGRQVAAVTARWELERTTSDLTTAARAVPRDTRWFTGAAVARQSSAVISSGTPVALTGISVARSFGVANESILLKSVPFLLAPGYALTFEDVTANQAISATVWGYERTLPKIEER